jgi:hypothetical protein
MKVVILDLARERSDAASVGKPFRNLRDVSNPTEQMWS